MVERKLVGAKRYMSEKTGPNVITHGQVISVSEEVAAELDELTYKDSANNIRFIFDEVDATPRTTRARAIRKAEEEKEASEDAEKAEDSGDSEESTEETKAPRRTSRKKTEE